MIGVKPAKFGNATIQCYCIDGDDIRDPEVPAHVQTKRYFKCAPNVCGAGWKKHTFKRTGESIYFVSGVHLGDVSQIPPPKRRLTDQYISLLVDPATEEVINAPPHSAAATVAQNTSAYGGVQRWQFSSCIRI